jgi:hypothetical protein
MERIWKMMTHLEIHEILELAMRGTHHDHLDECAFCREEYDNAVELMSFEASALSHSGSDADEPVEWSRQFRLAAQDSDSPATDTHVRRTWYLENGTVVLRVMEDTERGMLYGHLIIDPSRVASISIRFSGIDQEYRPDTSGTFLIGSASIEIEKMDVLLMEGDR